MTEKIYPPYVVFVDQMTGELLMSWNYDKSRDDKELFTMIYRQQKHLEEMHTFVTWFFSNNPEPNTEGN